jgi:energy-coupling factor transport system ATP-binding protein
VLEARGLRVAYPGGAWIGPFDLEAAHGLTLLTGPSGCGKSSIIRCLAGIVPGVQPARVEGRLRVGGMDPASIPAQERPGVVGWISQALTTATPTPWEEVALPLEQMRVEPAETRRRVAAWLDRMGLADKAHEPIHSLSGGQRARVVAAAALAPEPKALLLDEPLAQLDPASRRGFLEALAEAVPRGTAVLAATHRPELWPGPAGRIEVGTVETLAPDTQAVAPNGHGPVLLEMRGVTTKGRATGPMSFSVPAGASVALSGDNASGKTTLLWLAAGLLPPASGSVRLMDRDPRALGTEDLVRALGFAFQDPAWHVTQDTVWDEASLTLGRLGQATDAAHDWLARFGLADLADRHPWDLSGGERQRLAVVTALAHDPSVALLDEPTRGMDATHRRALVAAAQDRAARGRSTVVVTHDESLAAALGTNVRLEAGR